LQEEKHPQENEALVETSNSTDSAIDLCGVKLTDMQLKFIINYLTPGQPYFHNAFQSALKAGYAKYYASSNIFAFLKREDIKKIIKANEHLVHDAINSAALRALELKQQRAFFDPADYYYEEDVEIKTKGGIKTIKRMSLKNLEEMSLEQRMVIDGVDLKGYESIPVYILPDRGKELNDLIKLSADYSKGAGSMDSEEETMEIIMERLTVKKTMRKEKDDISETANLIRLPRASDITEL
jgi:phage terminase small subunit